MNTLTEPTAPATASPPCTPAWDRLSLAEIKDRLRIPEAWRRLHLPGDPAKGCKSPFREDQHPSFSIYDDGRRFKDFGDSDCRGDVLNFIALALPGSAAEAIAWARAQLGDAAPPKAASSNGKAKWPPLHPGTEKDFLALHRLRGIGTVAQGTATERGFLHFGKWFGHDFWALTDRRRRYVELRRMDGQPWPAFRDLKERKSHCKGQGKAWPLGIEEAAPFPKVALMEGAPDFLAFFEYLHGESKEDLVAPIAMLGGTNQIAPEAAALLAGKEVRLYPHADEEGKKAAQEWARTLLEAGAAQVHAFDLSGIVKKDGTAGNDLCDSLYLRMSLRVSLQKWSGVLP